MKGKYRVALVGATGLVGRELLALLETRNFPVEELRLFSSFNTAGEKVEFKGEEHKVMPLEEGFSKGADLVFFAAHPMVSRDLAEEAAREASLVIDSSRTFRLHPEVPLVVPEINREQIRKALKGKKLVASPSAAAVALGLVIHGLSRKWGLKRVVATAAYGSTAAGRLGFEEHQFQTIDIFNQREIKIEKFPRQTAFNIFPRVGELDEEGHSQEEKDIMEELPKLLGKTLPLSITVMQAPVFCGLCLAVNVEFDKAAPSPEAVRRLLDEAPGVRVADRPEADEYPDTLLAMESDEVLAGRIRRDPGRKNALQLWVSADNLRKGSALNMLQIAEAWAEMMD